jgi:hypothetical protein
MKRGPAVLLLLLVAASAPGGGAKDALAAPVLLPAGGVADPAGQVGYFRNTSGGIDALDLETGKLLWATREASHPLLATADRLFAHAPVPKKANGVRVVVLDVKNQGKRVLESQGVMFPEWVSVGPGHGRSFAATARLAPQGLLLIWNARAWYAGGAQPTPEIEQAARKSASGVVRVDPASGQVAALEGARVPKGMPTTVPAPTDTVKLGTRVYRYTDRPSEDKRKPFQVRRTLQAADAAGKVLWRHEIFAPVFLPPPP